MADKVEEQTSEFEKWHDENFGHLSTNKSAKPMRLQGWNAALQLAEAKAILGGQTMTIYTTVHRYEQLTAENRPQDETLDGSELTFKTMEHGGKFPDAFPNVIEITDKEGRSCRYAPITQNGEDVKSLGFIVQVDTGVNLGWSQWLVGELRRWRLAP